MKTALLYTPWVVISTSSFVYYHFWQSQEMLYIANLANMVAFLSLFILVCMLTRKDRVYSMPLRVQAEHMTGLIVFPKFTQHAYLVYSELGIMNAPLNPYIESIIPYLFVGIFLISTPIRIWFIKRKMRYDGL